MTNQAASDVDVAPPRAPEPEGPAGAPDEASARWLPFVDGLRAFVARRVPEADVDDVAQEVFLRLHRASDRLATVERPEAWVYGVARHAIADHFRHTYGPDGSRNAEPVEEDQLVAEAPPEPGFDSFDGDHGVHEEVLSWLRPLAEWLPDGYRQALVMADFEDRTQAEVAEELGLSLSGAKSRVQRARRMLGEDLRRCCEVVLGPEGRVVEFRRREPDSCGCD